MYHLHRKDPRHNFAPYFYGVYVATMDSRWIDVSWIAFPAQAISTFAVGLYFHRALEFAMLLQTLLFVMFNKVCTAQYFVWYFSLLPLALPSMQLSDGKAQGFYCCLGLWILVHAVWLMSAFHLEMGGMPIHIGTWAASLGVLLGNTALFAALVQSFHFSSANATTSTKAE
eukprot:jgi/Botrbrau1/21637/Bobra.43_1s0039.1